MLRIILSETLNINSLEHDFLNSGSMFIAAVPVIGVGGVSVATSVTRETLL